MEHHKRCRRSRTSGELPGAAARALSASARAAGGKSGSRPRSTIAALAMFCNLTIGEVMRETVLWVEGIAYAAWHDRAWPDGREHGAPPDAGGTSLCRVRPLGRRGWGAGQRGRDGVG